MLLHCTQRDDEFVGDGLIGVPSGDQLQDFEFAGRQGLDRGEVWVNQPAGDGHGGLCFGESSQDLLNIAGLHIFGHPVLE